MLDNAQSSCIYQKIRRGQYGKMTEVVLEQYDVIVAAGVVSLGEAPPETLSLIIDHLAATRLIALSFSDPTLTDGASNHVVGNEIALGRISLVAREYQPHIQKQKMGSNVIMLKRL